MRIWIARLRISPRVAAKIENVHRISPHELRDAIECVKGLSVSQDFDVERGRRVIVKTKIRDQDALVVLYPGDDPVGDVWRLGSVYFTRGRSTGRKDAS